MHDGDAVAHAGDLFEVRRNEDDGSTAARQFHHLPVDLDLGADVDTRSRFVEQEDFGITQEPAADDDLLLVAAGKVAGGLIEMGRLDA